MDNTASNSRGRGTQPQPNFDKKKARKKEHTLQLLCAVVIMLTGAAVFVWGFYVPPQGEIHPSVLVGSGEFLTFAGALFGIDYHYKAKMLHK